MFYLMIQFIWDLISAWAIPVAVAAGIWAIVYCFNLYNKKMERDFDDLEG